MTSTDAGGGARRPFEGLRVIDTTHVLAGPFATYQLALLGADVIKVELAREPDQVRSQGSDRALSRAEMGTMYLAQGSNKRAMALDLKTEGGREVLRRLAATADVFVENYRPGAFEALGLGYRHLAEINPKLIYCSMSAFGQDGPRGGQTGYDNVIQALSGVMAATGTPEVHPVKLGSPVIDYASGTTGAFALAAALFQRERTGQGQRIDMAMLDVGLMMMSSYVAGYGWNRGEPKPNGNAYHFATMGAYDTADGLLMLSASNLRQAARLWRVLGRPDLVKANNDERIDGYGVEADVLTAIMKTRTAAEWEEFLQARHIPAGRVRGLAEAMADPQLKTRGVLHEHAPADGLDRPFVVPVAAFKFAHGGPRVDRPPPAIGADTEAILHEIGYSPDDVLRLRGENAI